MNPLGEQIIFKQLLDRHHRVQIPMIQRDYAQGRPSEKEVREEFLNALHSALLLPPDHESLPLNLDFIYGSVEGDGETRFLPLDGQQRLTTLFLLHWYLAWKDGCQEDFHAMLCPKGVSRFSYSVRPSSTEFFDALVNFSPDISPDDLTSLRALIANQPWYFRYWRLDPTIQSSLTMLESIHARFRDTDGLFLRLVDEAQPTITFQLLDLENFGLSDDLYIKMNARGKPLTAFETFKARYEQDLGEHFVGETRNICGQSFPVGEFFARRMDTQWADFFWSHRDEETSLYDDAVMNLFRAVAIVTRDPESDTYLDDILSLRNKWKKSSYAFFHGNGWLDRRFSETLFMLLEAWSKDGSDIAKQLPGTQFFNEVTVFTKAVSEPTALTTTEIVQFFGYIVFMQEHADDVDSEAFHEWMRIVFNLSVNTNYERPADMQRSIAGIVKMASNSGRILEHFATAEKPATGFNLQQISEEKLKAELIKEDASWRPLVDRAEVHGYFRGQIEFLLDFCGVREKWISTEDVNWGADAHVSLREKFEDYLKKAETMFNPRGLASLGAYRWERALLSIGDYLLPKGRNSSFLVNSSTEADSWKRLLRGTGNDVPEARKLLHMLLERLTDEGAFETQLDEVISCATGLEPWRKAFVETPAALEYCGQHAIRWNSEEGIYLLKKVQMNGAHAELFTFCLFHNSLLGLAKEGRLSPLNLRDYQSVYVTEVEPHILLDYSHEGQRWSFKVQFFGPHFITYTGRGFLDGFPERQAVLCNSLNFQESGEVIIRESSPTDIKDHLLELAQSLAELSS